MNASRLELPLAGRIVAAIVEVITSLDDPLADRASGPQLIPARVRTGRR